VRRLGAFGFALIIGCGATVTHVRGPDGQDWIMIGCKRSEANCYEAAGEECPHGYFVGDRRRAYGTFAVQHESGGFSGSVNGDSFNGGYSSTAVGMAVPVYQGEMLIKCKSFDGEELAEPTRPTPRRSAGEGGEAHMARATDAPRPCNAAFEHVGELGQLWVQLFGGTALRAAPGRESFRAACADLDDDAQLCLVVPYARAHEDTCTTTLRGLPAASRQALDRLFLRSTGAAASQ
jgi:hypothetical protein